MSALAVRQSDGLFDPDRPENDRDQGIISTFTPEVRAAHRASREVAIPDLYLKDQGAAFRILSEWLPVHFQ